MILQRTRGLQSILLLLQSILLAVSFALSLLVTLVFIPMSWRQIHHYPLYALIMIMGLFIEFNRRDLLGKQFNPLVYGFLKQHQVSLNQTLFATSALFIYLVATKDNFISRTSLALYLPALYLTLLWSNRYLWSMLAYTLFRGTRRGRVLLIGTPLKALHLKSWLKSKEIYGIETIGILCDETDPFRIPEGLPRLGEVADVEKVIEKYGIVQVILLQLPEDVEEYRNLMDTMEHHGVRLLVFNNLEDKLRHPVIYIEDNGYHFISLRKEPLENPLNRVTKRLLDVSIALPMVLFILPPIAIVVWLIQRFSSPGPLFLQQTRAGIQNHQFAIWKFRTMHVDNPDKTRQATRHDARIYRGGHFLRRFSIDELPQFWNVLKGEMSVTGPRPHMIEHNAQFAKQIAHYAIRTVVKPGITGLAQVRGFRGEARTASDIARRLESDIDYLENWRLSLDLAIILRTIWQMVFPPKTAY